MSDLTTQRLIAALVPEGSRVLDLGCGDGALLDLLQRERGGKRRASAAWGSLPFPTLPTGPTA